MGLIQSPEKTNLMEIVSDSANYGILGLRCYKWFFTEWAIRVSCT